MRLWPTSRTCNGARKRVAHSTACPTYYVGRWQRLKLPASNSSEREVGEPKARSSCPRSFAMSLSNESKEYLDQYKAAPPVPPRWLDLHAKFWAGGQAGGATTADVVHLVSTIDKRLDWPIMIRPDYLQVWAGVLDRLKRSSARATVLRGQPGVGASPSSPPSSAG